MTSRTPEDLSREAPAPESPALAAPRLVHMCDLRVEVAPPRAMGQGRGGERKIMQITGGTVSGPRLNGRILNLGADWLTLHEGGLAVLDARYAFETEDGALIEMRDSGFRHGPADVMAELAKGGDVSPDAYYMRSSARLETGDPRYHWVNRTIFISRGARLGKGVVISLFAVE
ncbi:hypothetical protein ADZ37_03505 [Pannonibacter phragmitetus]|uniref:DUF3237 domain-containing protein n=1 Tax=Pannonibacter phragmitetus TaxID=121719 RepID=UPI00067AEF36|nr:DUF3237 domain-containing protein [Pannonibacter phragmitetus]KND20486.1 hypothetical protein ADZ37_03505 [Pannonibacter phragmitetus]